MESWWDLGEHSGYRGGELELYRLECAFCRVQGNFSLAHREVKKHASNKKNLNFDTLKCGNCANFLLVFWSAGSGLYDYSATPRPLGDYQTAPEAWPTEVGRFWLQARRNLRTNNLDAASVMARSALQATLRDQKARGRSLNAEIDDLAANGLLPPVMKDWANELRLLGNLSAHPSLDDPAPTKKNVTDVIEYLEYLLTYLYDLPTRIDKYRGRKKEGVAEGS